MPVSGRLIAAGGHLHDFGKELRLEDLVSGRVLARVKAKRTPTGEVTGVSHALYGMLRGPHLVAGRQYRLVAVYQGAAPRTRSAGRWGLWAASSHRTTMIGGPSSIARIRTTG